MCRGSALWLMRRALAGGADQFEILPCRSPVRRERYPQITDEACMAAMQLVLPDGRVLSGADAAPEIIRRIPRWRWLAGAFALPGVRPLRLSPRRGPSPFFGVPAPWRVGTHGALTPR